MVWNAVGALNNLFGSLSGSNASTGLNRADTKWMYNQQSKFWKKNTEWYNMNGYDLLRQGLEKAGYNPLMALGAQPMNGATVSGSAMDSDSNNFAVDLPHSVAQELANIRNTSSDSLLKGAQTEENISRSNLENAEKVLKDKEANYYDKEKAAYVRGLELDNDVKQETIKNVQADTGMKLSIKELNDVQQQYYKSLTSLNYTQQIHFNKIIEKMDWDMKLTQDDYQWLQDNPKQAQFLQYVRRYGGALATILNPVATGIGAYVIGSRKGSSANNIKVPESTVKISPLTLPY